MLLDGFTYPNHQIDHKPHLYRNQREIPLGLSKRDARILKSVKRRAHHLDTGLSICGFRIGWTFFFGTEHERGLTIYSFLNPHFKGSSLVRVTQ